MSLVEGAFACIPGDMQLSPVLHARLRERFPVDQSRSEFSEIGRKPSRWFCPGCGIPLGVEATCSKCGQSLRDLIQLLVELHPHCDEAKAARYKADLATWKRRLEAVQIKPERPPFERFTDRARKVMQLADQEAARLNHPYRGTGDILLALLFEGSGVAANLLKRLGVDLHRARILVRSIAGHGIEPVTQTKLPLTPRAARAIKRSIAEAHQIDHHYVGTEHLLLALLGDPESEAVQVLATFGLQAAEVRHEVYDILGHFLDEDLPEAAGED